MFRVPAQYRRMIEGRRGLSYVYYCICGFFMGSADLVPGVSGSTVALLGGLYERFLGELKKLSSALRALLLGRWQRTRTHLSSVEWKFLILLLAGAAAAFLSLSRAMGWLLENRPEATAGAFFGLVGASALVAARTLGRWRTWLILLCAAAAVGSGWAFGLSASPATDPPLTAFFLVGAVAVCAMLLPGVSGSFVMLMFGMYAAVIDALREIEVVPLVLVTLGVLLGAATASPLLAILLKRHYDVLMSLIVGIMLGSLRILWPWPGGVGVISSDASEAVDGTGFAWPAGDEVFWPVVCAVLSFILAFVAGNAGRRLSSLSSDKSSESLQT